MPFRRSYRRSYPMRRTATRRIASRRFSSASRLPPVVPSTGQAITRYGARDPYANKLYQVKQNLPDTYVASGTSAVYGGYSYTVNALDNATAFASVFDQYRIDRIQVTFRPMNVATPLVNTATSGFIAPIIYTAIDYDDSSAPTSVAGIRDYNNCSSHLYETFTLDWKPSANTTLGTSTAAGNVSTPWVDWAFPAIPHYGIKLAIPSGTAGFEQQWTVSIVMYLSMRNVH